jgi:hypothetical protein
MQPVANRHSIPTTLASCHNFQSHDAAKSISTPASLRKWFGTCLSIERAVLALGKWRRHASTGSGLEWLVCRTAYLRCHDIDAEGCRCRIDLSAGTQAMQARRQLPGRVMKVAAEGNLPLNRRIRGAECSSIESTSRR